MSDALHHHMHGDFYTCNFAAGSREGTIILNLGPQHPSTHGVLRILLEMEGEYIVRAEPVIGYLHRMHEKMAEVKTAVQYMPNMGRVDYLHAMAWNWAYAGAVERLAGIEVPERAEYLRVIATELNRISSHLVWWGAYLLDLGAFTPIMYGFDDREHILEILQIITGSRLTYSWFRFGGTATDAPPEFFSRAREFVKRMRSRLSMYRALVTDNMIVRRRLEGVGHISADMCLRYGGCGPVARGSGLAWDVRKDEPYSVYSRFAFTVPVERAGDCMARYLVRMEEIAQSLNIIEQAVETIPDGPVRAANAPKPTFRLPAGEACFAVEASKGKAKAWVVGDGGKNPYRVKLRAPSFSNLSLFGEAAEGMLLADAVAFLGSLDLVIPEIDR